VKYLLDTNVLSEPLRPQPNDGIIEALASHSADLATASVVWHELRFGCARLADSKRRRAVEDYLRDVVQPSVPILGYDAMAAQWHAAERARLQKAGKVPPFVDGQIAAIAAVHGLTLVTRNLKDFRRYRGLSAVDWSR
jgi:tRNA(fMet)-specific endonuclease VapC